MTWRLLVLGPLMLLALAGPDPVAAAAENRCADKKFPANARVRSDDLNDLFGRVALPNKPLDFVFVAASGSDPDIRRARVAMEAEAKRFGVGLTVRPSGETLAGNPSAVLFPPGGDWKELLEKARERDIPTVAVGGRVEGARLSVAADPQLFGAMAGEYLHELYPLGTSLAYLSVPNVGGTDGLAEGFAKEIAHYPSLVLAGSIATDGTKNGARTATATIMAAHPEVKGLYAGSDEAAVGAIEALKSLKLFDVAVVGTGGAKTGRDALVQRTIKGTVARFPEREGAIAVQAALRLVACQQLPPWIVPPQVTLTSKSLEDIPPISN